MRPQDRKSGEPSHSHTHTEAADKHITSRNVFENVTVTAVIKDRLHVIQQVDQRDKIQEEGAAAATARMEPQARPGEPPHI